jgi:hypothetical protein
LSRQRILDRHALAPPALTRVSRVRCLLDAAPSQRPRCTLGTPSRRRAQRVEDASLLQAAGRSVALRHRRQILSPRAAGVNSRSFFDKIPGEAMRPHATKTLTKIRRQLPMLVLDAFHKCEREMTFSTRFGMVPSVLKDGNY